MTVRDLWTWVTTGQRPTPDHVDTKQLTIAHPTRLVEIEQRAAADAEAKVLRISGKVSRPAASLPAITGRKKH